MHYAYLPVQLPRYQRKLHGLDQLWLFETVPAATSQRAEALGVFVFMIVHICLVDSPCKGMYAQSQKGRIMTVSMRLPVFIGTKGE